MLFPFWFSVKFAGQNFTKMCYIKAIVSGRSIVKIRNPLYGFLNGIARVFRSDFKTAKFSVYHNNTLKVKIHLH